MPTYEYACTECGNRIEVVQSISEAPLTTCTVCGGALRKVFSPVGIVFKGSGFYRTDSRGKPGARADDARDKDKDKDKDKAKAAGDGDSKSKASSSDGGGSGSTAKAAEKSA
jgi:putative FmdB family regulatory protein